MRSRWLLPIVGLTLAMLTVVGSSSADANPALDEGEVVLRSPPFERWCIAPICSDPGSAAPRVRPPLALPSTREAGLLERELRKALLSAVVAAIGESSADWNHRASRDALNAVVAVLSRDEVALARTRGLGAAVARAGLVMQTARAIPVDDRCTGARRIDAVYEGLAMGPLGALGFTESTGRVERRCVDTARVADRFISRLALAAIAAASAPELARADGFVREVAGRCAVDVRGLDEASVGALSVVREVGAEPSVSDVDRVLGRLRRDREALAKDQSALGEACSRAIEQARASGSDVLDKLVAAGLGAVPARALAQELATTQGPCVELAAVCEARAAVTPVVAAFIGGGSLTREQLLVVIRALVAGVIAPNTSPGTGLDCLPLLELAIVSTGVSTTLDPDVLVAEMERRYAVVDGKPSLRSLVGLGPSPWIVELNGAVPKLDSGDARVIGDATLGYEGKSLGVVVRGGVRYFDFASPVLATDNLDAQGWLESWLVTGDERSRVRFETRLSGGGEYIDTTTVTRPIAPTGRVTFGDYDSLLIRGSLLAGVRLKAGERLGLRFLAGGGAQYETFDSTSVSAGGLQFNSPSTWSGQGSGRVDVRWKIVPAILSARGHVNGQYFSVTREEVALLTNTGTVAQVSVSQTNLTQVALSSRLFIDADIASFAGFVPAVFGGADFVYLQAPQGERSTTVPFAGIGIVRPRL